VVTDANIQDGLEQWDIPAKMQYTFYIPKFLAYFPFLSKETRLMRLPCCLCVYAPLPTTRLHVQIVMWEATLVPVNLSAKPHNTNTYQKCQGCLGVNAVTQKNPLYFHRLPSNNHKCR
jgi:hypothetical protein